jgi:hypothetical protein
VAAAYDGDEVVEGHGGLDGLAAASRLVGSYATVAVVTGNSHWLWPVVLHAVAASEWTTPSLARRADYRIR